MKCGLYIKLTLSPIILSNNLQDSGLTVLVIKIKYFLLACLYFLKFLMKFNMKELSKFPSFKLGVGKTKKLNYF